MTVGMAVERPCIGSHGMAMMLRRVVGWPASRGVFAIMAQRSAHGADCADAAICCGMVLEILMDGLPLVARGSSMRARGFR